MVYKISQERLNRVCFSILDEIYGVLHNNENPNAFYDEENKGRILIRKGQPHIYYKDLMKMINEVKLDPYMWGYVIKDWMKERFDRDVKDEFVWLTWSI